MWDSAETLVEAASQWSLTFEVRKSVPERAYWAELSQSQWSLTFEVRKSVPERAYWAELSQSQWSLTFEVRKSGGVGGTRDARVLVAMEPDL